MCNPSKKTIKRIEQMLETRCKKVQKFEQHYQGSTTANYMNREPTEPGFQGVLQIRGRGQFLGVKLTKSEKMKANTHMAGFIFVRLSRFGGSWNERNQSDFRFGSVHGYCAVKRTKKSIHGRNGCVLRKVSDVCRSDKPDND